jgi:SAM-dependent methyltransferase
MKDGFIQISDAASSIDLYYIRNAILKAISNVLPDFRGKLLDIGCGKMPYRDYILENSDVIGYIGMDIETATAYDKNISPDYYWDGANMPFDDEKFDTAFATEVLEHCPDPATVLNETYRVLKPGGVFFFTVPFLWNLHEVPNDEYRYTPFALERLLSEAGFINIQIKATGGWHASLAQMLGLWVRRSPISKRKKKYFSILLKPLIRFLIKIDKRYPVKFTEAQMITGLSGTASK